MTPHPLRWPNTDASHRIIRTDDGEHRCEFCDTRPGGRASRAPCDAAPDNWRARLDAGESWIHVRAARRTA